MIPERTYRGSLEEDGVVADSQVAPGSRTPRPLCVLGAHIPLTIPTSGAITRDADLRRQCVVETVQTEHMAKSS